MLAPRNSNKVKQKSLVRASAVGFWILYFIYHSQLSRFRISEIVDVTTVRAYGVRSCTATLEEVCNYCAELSLL